MTRLVFAGTPAFALASLQALVDSGRQPVAVYTQPDRPAGRGRKLTASPVKQFAAAAGIDVYQPESLRDPAAIDALRALEPELLIVAAYGLILPQEVLDIPSHGCLNVHASLLPRWRGAAPIQAAILAGDAVTGVTLMQMSAGLDCGPVFAERVVPIEPGESAALLHDRLATAGGELLVEQLDAIATGTLLPEQQDEALVTYAPKIATADAELDWRLPAAQLERRVRAYNPAPGAWFLRGEQRIKVWQSELDSTVQGEPGSIVQFDGEGIVVACGAGGLRLTELQAPGKRRAAAHEFVQQINLR
ncbi:MAG: methionyl-tRNA formyltransferase [Pseudomonadota bacterium]